MIPSQSRQPIFRAFRHRNFGIFYAGQTISLVGTWSQGLAVSWLVWRLTQSTLWLGIIGFTLQIPMLIFGLPGGVVADRYDRLRTLVFTQVLCMIQAGVLALLTFSGRIELWQVVALSIFLGTVYAFEFPLRHTFVMDMVGRQDLLNAISLNSAMLHATRIAGPVAAGLIVAWRGEGACFLFNAATFIALIAALGFVDRKALAGVKTDEGPFIKSVVEGLRYVWREPRAKVSLFLVVAVTIFGFPYVCLLPVFADRVFGGGAVELGWLMGASGAGALMGALWLARRRSTGRLLLLATTSSVVFSLALMIFSHVPILWAALVVLCVAGFFLTIVFSSINTLLQEAAPDHLRGRVMSQFTIAFMGFAPFGSLLAGVLACAVGAQMALLVCGVSCLTMGCILWVKARRLQS